MGLAVATASIALLADAYHSGVDLTVSIALMGCLLFRIRQERANKPSGTQQAHYLDAIVAITVALLILYVPFQILLQSETNSSGSIDNLAIGICGMLVVIASLLFISRFKRYVGKQTGSLALEADGHHSQIDLYTSVAVLCSLVGSTIGIDIDQYVAIAISVLIGFSGLSLLFAGIRTLVVKEEFRELSAIELYWLLHTRLSAYGGLAAAFMSQISRLWQLRYYIIATSLTLYLASGITTIPLGYTGIKYRLAEPVATHLAPGLHYALPQPFGHVELLMVDDVRAITVGSSAGRNVRPAGANLWLQSQGRNSRNDDTPYLLTGDETLLYLELSLMYRIDDPVYVFQQISDVDALIKQYAKNALWQQVSKSKYDNVFGRRQSQFANQVESMVNHRLAQAKVPVSIIGTNLTRVQPPATLVTNYRNVLNAYQQSQDLVNQAIAMRLHDLPLARSEQTRMLGQIAAQSAERVLLAEGEMLQAYERAGAFQESPESYTFELWWKTALDSLSQQAVTLVHPDINSNDLRVWELSTNVNQ